MLPPLCSRGAENKNRIIYGKPTAADYFSLYSSHCPHLAPTTNLQKGKGNTYKKHNNNNTIMQL